MNLPKRLWYSASIEDSRLSMRCHWQRQEKRQKRWMGVLSLRKYFAFMMNLQLSWSACMKQESSSMQSQEMESIDSLSQLERKQQSWDWRALRRSYSQRLLNHPIREQQPLFRILDANMMVYYYSRKSPDKNLRTYCRRRLEQGDYPSKQHLPIVLTKALKMSMRQGSGHLALASREKQRIASCGSDLARNCMKLQYISFPQRHLKYEERYVLRVQLLVRIQLRRMSMLLRIFSTPFEKSIERTSPSLVTISGRAVFSFGMGYSLAKSASVKTSLIRWRGFILNCLGILQMVQLTMSFSLLSVDTLLCLISSFFENFDSFFCQIVLSGLISLLRCAFDLAIVIAMLSDWLNGFFMISLRIFLMSVEPRKEELLLVLLVGLAYLVREIRSYLRSRLVVETS